MTRYRSKPIEIDAIALDDPNLPLGEPARHDVRLAALLFANERSAATVAVTDLVMWEDYRTDGMAGSVYDYLQQTWVPFRATDMLTCGTKGELYPCDIEVFQAKYEEVG